MKKKRLRAIVVIVIILLLIYIVASIQLQNKRTSKKTYEVSDKTQDTYITEHFDKNCKSDFRYIAHNADDMVYVDGKNLYRFSDQQVILKNVNVTDMIYTDRFLYVLDDCCILHLIDLSSLDSYEIENIKTIKYNANKLYLEFTNCIEIYCVDENELIKDNTVADVSQLKTDDKRTEFETCSFGSYVFGDNGTIYWVNCDRGEHSVCREINVGEDIITQWVAFDDSYIVRKGDLSIYDDKVYILYRVHATETTYESTQAETYCDGILSLDFNNKKSEKVYETENNLTRIVGFDSDNNIVYLYDVNSYRIYELNLGTNKQTTICSLEKKYNSLVFEMSKDVLFIYTDNNELVQIVELKK